MPDIGETLNKRIASAGICSRRKAVDLIKEGSRFGKLARLLSNPAGASIQKIVLSAIVSS